MKVTYFSLFSLLVLFTPIHSLEESLTPTIINKAEYNQRLSDIPEQPSFLNDLDQTMYVQKELFMQMVLEAFKNNDLNKKYIHQLVKKIRTKEIYVTVWNEILQEYITITEKDFYKRLLPYMPWNGTLLKRCPPYYCLLINGIPTNLLIENSTVTTNIDFPKAYKIYAEFADLIYSETPKLKQAAKYLLAN